MYLMDFKNNYCIQKQIFKPSIIDRIQENWKKIFDISESLAYNNNRKRGIWTRCGTFCARFFFGKNDLSFHLETKDDILYVD